MRSRVVGAILFLLGVLVLLIPRYILPVCEYQGYNAMACSYTGIAEMFMGFIIVTISAGIFFSKTTETVRWSAVTALAAGVAVMLLPETIGYCHNSRMPCNYGTIPALRLSGALVILVSSSGLLFSLRKGNAG